MAASMNLIRDAKSSDSSALDFLDLHWKILVHSSDIILVKLIKL